MGRKTEREQRIVIRWRARGQAEAISPTLHRAYPTDEELCFDEALKAIDEAEREVWDPGGAADKLE
jgi:type II secretory pathway predicted ATPase ExeA